ncbi:MAG: C40 family peptidase [Epsilonproteobacteria bacterium]|nr:C40 family peptidase [Campylobacterota bacterium]
MRKIKRLSLAMVISPLLFSGCMQEKVSTISPSKPTDNSMAINSKQMSQTLLSKVETTNDINTTENNISTISSITPETVDYTDDLSTLMELVESNIDMEITGQEGSFTTAVEVGEDWTEVTKEDEIISTAIAYLDTKYIWAANGPSAFDCSGFTKYVFKEHGMTLPRYSGHQANTGTKVSFDELEKGDLVFFDTEKKYHGKVNHVGIYMGNGEFIHASSAKKKVIITSFNKKRFYKKRFLWGQRVVNTHATYASL